MSEDGPGALPAGPDRSGELVAGKYRLNRRLGSGGMAEVWSATNRFTEREVAIKLLSREVASANEDATARFLNEAKVSARVDHPNVALVLDVGQTDDGQLFLVMELLTGLTLETALRRQTPPMTTHELVAVMIDVASALEATHAAGIVHRDLKPSNVFLHKTKSVVQAKLLDFGVSKFRSEDDPSITIAGTVLGSPLYMSPEQARGETDVDGRTDVFAFGGMLFEALTGFRAYDAKNFNALIVKIATTRPKDIDAEAPALPASLRRVVRACLEPDLARRAATFTEVLALLRAALPDVTAAPTRLPPGNLPAALFDPDATHALPVFTPSAPLPVPLSSPSAPERARAVTPAPPPAVAVAVDERTAYEAALAPRVAARPSPWWPLAFGAIVIAGLAAYAQRTRSAPSPERVQASADEVANPAAAASAPPAAEAHARLEVVASPGRCSVSVDGAPRGESPVTVDDLAPGDHTIECTRDRLPPRRATVNVTGSLRYRFLLEER